MRVIICEKPSVARQFAAALGVTGKQEGYISGKSSVDGEEYTITWAIGHLVAQSYPEKYDPELKAWKLSTLPFIPTKWKYELIKDVKKQFDIINGIFSSMKPGDVYYNAGDSGREGEYIQRLILQESKMPTNIEQKRVWIDSQTEVEILRGIREAKPVSEYDHLSDSAYLRAKEDYLVGINFSRALSCAFGREFNQKIKSNKYKPISVGRVMTCVLGMIVRREREIRNFVEHKFYKIEADTGFKTGWKATSTSAYYNSPLLYSEVGFKKEDDAIKFTYALASEPHLKVTQAKQTPVKKQAPTLYNLAELQAECSKKFKISPDKTLEIAQSLYEKKLTTYPRTDARVISTAVAKEIYKNINGIKSNLNMFVSEVDYILSNNLYSDIGSKKKYCDDSKITDHYAIIPTGEGLKSGLSELEEKVFDVICRRFLAIFYPAAQYNKVEVVLMHQDKEQFSTSTEILLNKGYLAIYSNTDDDDEKKEPVNTELLKKLKVGDILDASFKVVEGKTKPPKRYTSGSMVIAMENAGNLIEDEELRAQIKGSGIGTSATRAETISKLVKLGYINLNTKTQVLTPALDGEAVFDIVEEHIPALLIPETTAEWEQCLADIASGAMKPSEYMPHIEQYVRKTVDNVKSQARESGSSFEKKEIGSCPICSGKLFTAPFGIVCENRQTKACKFTLGNNIIGRNFKESELMVIISKFAARESTPVFDGFISKKGSKFSASLRLDQDGTIKLEFPEKPTEVSSFICPKCQKNFNVAGAKLKCDCGFEVWTMAFGKKLTDGQLKSLLRGESIKATLFSKKKNCEYEAYLTMEDDGNFKQSFEEPS